MALVLARGSRVEATPGLKAAAPMTGQRAVMRYQCGVKVSVDPLCESAIEAAIGKAWYWLVNHNGNWSA